ncbi:MAG: hypothetical protein WC350_05195 [Candidatus Micrarchaeia archaeon]|jgi:hypothetical protein
MTHKTTVSARVAAARISAFERHLRTDRKGVVRSGSNGGQDVMVANIMFAHAAARFPIPVKVAVLEDMHCPADPEKSFAALNALGKMAMIFPESRDAFARAAKRWHEDITMKAVHPNEWLEGKTFIQTYSRWLPEDVRDKLAREAGAGQ